MELLCSQRLLSVMLTGSSVKTAQILHPYNKTTVGRSQEMTSQPSSLTFQHHFFFHEIRTPTANKHAKLVEIGLPQIPMTLQQLAKRIQQTL